MTDEQRLAREGRLTMTDCGYAWIVREGSSSAQYAICAKDKGHQGDHRSIGVASDFPSVVHMIVENLNSPGADNINRLGGTSGK